MILLDTNAMIAVLNGRPAGVRERLSAAVRSGEAVATSSIVLFELQYGVARSRRKAENAERLRVLMSGPLQVIPLDEEDAMSAGDLRGRLKALGKPIGPFDLLIAGQALRRGATLVSANTREFGRVPDLRLEDWTGVV